MSKIEKHSQSGPLLRRLVREAVAPYGSRVALAAVFMVLVAATTAALAWLMDPVVNRVFVERRSDLLWSVGGAVFAAFMVKGMATYAQTVLMTGVGQSVLMDMQNRLFRHLMHQDLAFFQRQSTGGLMSRFTTDIGMMRQAVSTALTGLGKDSLSVIFLVGVMFYQDWLLATLAFVVFPATVIPITRLGRRLRRVTADTQMQTGGLMTVLQQTFTGMRLIKSYRMEEYETNRAAEMTQSVRDLVMRAERVKALSSPLMETVGGVAVTIVIVYGGWRVIQDTTTPGAFFSFITALLMAYRPMKALANLNAQIQEGLAGAERLFAILDEQPALKESGDVRPLSVVGGGIQFDRVSFTYADGKVALKEISLNAEPGKTTALVGPSGSGKTTLLNLVPRFFDPDSGHVSIDSQDLRGVTFESLRSSIALVSQDVVLFDDTVRANIRFGYPTATDDEVSAAARAAGAEDFILEMPLSYDTRLGERGETLSGGQRQRIAIARAILKDAPILLLDEATSALDAETEKQIQVAMDALRKGRTTVVIAHRLTTVQHADCIHVIVDGQVVETGKHAELSNAKGPYSRLSALQFDNYGSEATNLA
ncbi:MAG: ABC transporter transmembrane domain-containing protein [Rhodospirillaceae bacterium]|nr:ABC transporter transmembrane domain-containing protein [Rhodospirillaceae bacterium]